MSTCTYEDCSTKHYARGWCFNHYRRWRRTGTPAGRQFGVNHYRSAHTKIVRERGKASEQACLGCDSPAEQWSYRGGAPDERVSVVVLKGVERNAPWSASTDYYDPLCRACHLKRDRWGQEVGVTHGGS
jgi:hypothetical protein